MSPVDNSNSKLLSHCTVSKATLNPTHSLLFKTFINPSPSTDIFLPPVERCTKKIKIDYLKKTICKCT